MQVKDIKIGGEYAVPHQHKDRALTVTRIVTEKTSDKAENFVGGFYFGDENGENGSPMRVYLEKVPVASLKGDYTQFAELVEARRKAEEERLALIAEREAKQWQAITLLASALGAQAVKQRYGSISRGSDGWDKTKPAVIRENSAILINEEAFPALVALLNKMRVAA